MEKIYILLPVHNRREITRRFVRCLQPQTHRDYHLILLDDGSTDGTEEMVRKEISCVTVIRGQGNWWWAGALQQGYEWLKAQEANPEDVVLIMNDDTVFEPDFLEKGIHLLGERSDVMLLAQSYGQASGELKDLGTHVDWETLSFAKATSPEEVNCLSTRGLFFKAGAFETIGGFHPRLLPHFTSDYEFTIRARRKGFKLMSDPSLKLWVDEEATWNRELREESFPVFVKRLFSKKSPVNPLVWMFFVALACPWRWKMLNWYRVSRNTAWNLTHAFLKEIRKGRGRISNSNL
jgi:GT2 family glycosyltransferase